MKDMSINFLFIYFIFIYGIFSEDLYQQLRCSLFERIKDKESSVRIQAATALSRLQSADDEPDPKDGRTITQKLIWILQCDPSA